MSLKIGSITRITLGVQGENGAKPIPIDVSEWLEEFPEGTISVWNLRHGTEQSYPAGAELDREAGILYWTPNSADTFYNGAGLCQFRLTDDGVVKKSVNIPTKVFDALPGTMEEEAPEEYQPWVNQVEGYKHDAEAAAAAAAVDATDAEAAKNAAETAELASAASATAAAASATAAEEAQDKAEDARDVILGMTAEAETLDAGEDATASYDPETGIMTFGIPRGHAGTDAPQIDDTVASSTNPWSGKKVSDELSLLNQDIDNLGTETGYHVSFSDFVAGHYINANGTLTSDDRFSISKMYKLSDSAEYVHISACKEAGTALGIAFYSQPTYTQEAFVNGVVLYNNTAPADFVIPDGAKYVSFSARNSSATFSANVDGTVYFDVLERVSGIIAGKQDLLTSGVNIKSLQGAGSLLGRGDISFVGFDVESETIPAFHPEGGKVNFINDHIGYIARSDGSVVNAGTGTWRYSDFIPLDRLNGDVGGLITHGNVANVAYYSSDTFGTYLGYIGATGTKTKDQVLDAAPDGTHYFILCTNSSSASELYAYLSADSSTTENIKIKAKSNNMTSGYAHFSFDDCTFWTDLIDNTDNYESVFENSFLADLKDIHDTYGATFTCNMFNSDKTDDASATHDISDVPSKFADEFAENSDWLKFAFHGEDITVLYRLDDVDGIKASYEKFVDAIITMTGTPICIDRFTRLSSYTGSLNNVLAIRDEYCGISGLLASDDTRANYYLTTDINTYLLKKGRYYDADNQMYFIKTQLRLENGAFDVNVFDTKEYGNYLGMLEFFTHETQWSSSVKNKTKNLCSWLNEHNFTYVFPENIYAW